MSCDRFSSSKVGLHVSKFEGVVLAAFEREHGVVRPSHFTRDAARDGDEQVSADDLTLHHVHF